jgi:hypothetical protein
VLQRDAYLTPHATPKLRYHDVPSPLAPSFKCLRDSARNNNAQKTMLAITSGRAGNEASRERLMFTGSGLGPDIKASSCQLPRLCEIRSREIHDCAFLCQTDQHQSSSSSLTAKPTVVTHSTSSRICKVRTSPITLLHAKRRHRVIASITRPCTDPLLTVYSEPPFLTTTSTRSPHVKCLPSQSTHHRPQTSTSKYLLPPCSSALLPVALSLPKSFRLLNGLTRAGKKRC